MIEHGVAELAIASNTSPRIDLSVVSLTFFVERLKGRLYVYEWINGEERYIGSLDEIVLNYLANKAR